MNNQSIRSYFLPFIIIFIITGCADKSNPLFRILGSDETGIQFNDQIIEDEYFNVLSNEYIYNGTGVGIGDFNNDGLQDIYFSGGMVSNKMFLNKGDLKFKDITSEAGVAADDIWSTGIAVIDINLDGWKDIYVCASNMADPRLRRNKLFIHQGLNDQGIPIFINEAEKFGVDDEGYSTHGVFLDYDKDHDLDLYVLTNFLETPHPNRYRQRTVDGTAPNNDRFYRNNGDGTFTEITKEAGIVYEGYGLGISIADFNLDGWPDIYITNDYLTNDLMYINNRDGTFSNRIADYIKHQTHSAMGHDAADVNNDGLIDIFTLDMLPESNQRLKQMHATSRFENNKLDERYGYEPQYKRNMLHINQGPDGNGHHWFSEIGLYAGIYATDWSWSALLADYDNDGYRDLFISNGYPKDVTDLDYATSGRGMGRSFSNEEVLKTIPSRHFSNYVFKNNSDLTFSDMTEEWGINTLSFSNGASYADFDNDGDLDIIVSNINEPAILYENRLNEVKSKSDSAHYLRVKLTGNKKLPYTFSTKTYVFLNNGNMLFEDYSPYHGFLSTREETLHFGLGPCRKIDSLIIEWPDQQKTKLYDLEANQTIEIGYGGGDSPCSGKRRIYPGNDGIYSVDEKIFEEVAGDYNLDFFHDERPFDDFSIQPSIPRQYSQSGPPAAVGDIDGNGEQDLVIGGSVDQDITVFMQKNGQFKGKSFSPSAGMADQLGLLLFDIENDGDLDLYIVMGGNESAINSGDYQDLLFENTGEGNFIRRENVLPEMNISGGCVKAADYDQDGDLDLFIGGRIIPGRYPQAVNSYILRNDSRKNDLRFTDVTREVCPELLQLGMVKDALWTDFNNDGKIDLMVTGDWMPVKIFQNEGQQFTDITEGSGLEGLKGWWNSLTGGDFDNDGDIDYLAGNLGLNSIYKASPEKPVKAYHTDFDNNGRYDVILTYFYPDKEKIKRAYPAHFRSDLNRQLDLVNRRFSTYKAYSQATLDSLLNPEEIELATVEEATCFESLYIENLGNGTFRATPLPAKAQWAPIYGMLPGDFNGDEFLDVLVVGNEFGNNVFWGRQDALNGLLLTGDGTGDFMVKDYPETGFLAAGDAKALAHLITAKGEDLIIATQNQDSLRFFRKMDPFNYIQVGSNEAFGLVKLADGKTRKQEFYYGSSYLSQTARVLFLPENHQDYQLMDFSGKITRRQEKER